MTRLGDERHAEDRALSAEDAVLRARIRELQETLESIRGGGIDAVIAGDPGQEKVYTLTSADRPYRVILEEMDEGAAVVSLHGLILYANPRLATMVGCDPESLVGTDARLLLMGDDADRVNEGVLGLAAGQTRRAEALLVTSGRPLPVLLAASGIDLEGTTVVAVVVTDLTMQKKVEQSLREGEDLLHRFLDNLPVGVYIARSDGTSQYGNYEAKRLVEVTMTPETVDRVLAELTFLHSDSGAPYPPETMPLIKALHGESAHVDDIAIKTASGKVVPLEVWATPVFAADASVEHALVTMADITERKRAEQTMAEQAAMLDLAHDAVVVFDEDYVITFWNRGAEAAYGFTRERALGANIRDLLQTTFPEPLERINAQLLATGQWEGEIEHHTADGRTVVDASRWAVYRGLDGRRLGTLEINRDVTARKRVEAALAERAAELEVANRELARSNQDLEQFAYVASHDMSEPLRAISLPISLLARRYEGQLGEDADEYIRFAVDGCARLQQMIDDLLRYSRVQRVEGALEPVACEFAVARALADLNAMIIESGATVTVADLPTVTAEPSQLKQIFQNLIANAVTFVAPDVSPRIEVAAERAGEFWRFTVTDNGIGIEAHQRERVFGLFKRLHSRDVYPGSGIGLALVKKSVERHGGQVGIEDAPSGHGTTVWFTLPVFREGLD